MTPDQERWAEALAVLRMHGDDVEMYLAERIAAMSLLGDVDGIVRWQEIGRRVMQVREAEAARH